MRPSRARPCRTGGRNSRQPVRPGLKRQLTLGGKGGGIRGGARPVRRAPFAQLGLQQHRGGRSGRQVGLVHARRSFDQGKTRLPPGKPCAGRDRSHAQRACQAGDGSVLQVAGAHLDQHLIVELALPPAAPRPPPGATSRCGRAGPTASGRPTSAATAPAQRAPRSLVHSITWPSPCCQRASSGCAPAGGQQQLGPGPDPGAGMALQRRRRGERHASQRLGRTDQPDANAPSCRRGVRSSRPPPG